MQTYLIRARCVIIHQSKVLLEFVNDEDFYFYPGGRLEPYETIVQAAVREIREEIDREFHVQKVLYIREFINKEKQDHSIEFFILGSLDNPTNIDHNPNNPDPKLNHQFKWIDIDNLPENVLPAQLTKKLQQDFHNNFANDTQYLGLL